MQIVLEKVGMVPIHAHQIERQLDEQIKTNDKASNSGTDFQFKERQKL